MQDFYLLASIGAPWYDPNIFLVQARSADAARRIAESMLSDGHYHAVEVRIRGRRLFTVRASAANDRLAA